MAEEPRGLEALPPELLLKIISLLSPNDIRSLCRVSRTLVAPDTAWRPLVHAVIAASDPTFSHSTVPADHGLLAGPWINQARFLLPRARFLGWFVSRSRLIRLTTTYTGSPPVPTIVASSLVPTNAFSSPTFSPTPPLVLPHGAHLDPSRTAYHSPRRGPGSYTPDSGLSLDLLSPTYILSPFFLATPHEGAVLHSPTGPAHALRVTVDPASADLAPSTEPQSEAERERAENEGLYALFTGRMPERPWPTRWMLGPPGPRGGALRGLEDWEEARGEVGEVVRREEGEGEGEGEGEERERLVCDGFHLEVRRRGAEDHVRAVTPPRPLVVENVWDDIPRRRRGPNGGPEIVWQGLDRDPEDRPGVAIIRVGNATRQELVFRLGHDVPLPGPARARYPDREDYFPIHAPARPLAFDSLSAATPSGDVLASSLEGLWVGTYGTHGLEFGHLSLRYTPPTDRPKPYGVQCPFPDLDRHPDLLPGIPLDRQVTRLVEYCKITGDMNVPSGQISWVAELPPISLDEYLSNSFGTVTSVRNSTLLRWSAPPAPGDPSSTPDWSQGTLEGARHVALSGFIQPSWTPAQIVLIRSEEEVRRVVQGTHGEDVEEVRVVEGVEEIRLRWKELGTMGCFRRVRI